MAGEPSVVHSSFRIEREYPASPARVFSAFADPATKRRWFVEGKGSEVQEFTLDFRVGGREATRFRFKGDPSLPGAPPAGTEFRNDTVYQDIRRSWRRVPHEAAPYAPGGLPSRNRGRGHAAVSMRGHRHPDS